MPAVIAVVQDVDGDTMRDTKVSKLTTAAMCAAFSFVLMYFGTVSGILDMSASVFCGLFTLIILRECNIGLSLGCVAVCSVLTFVLLPDKTASILYLTVGGLYPVLKPVAERIRTPFVWVIKVLMAAAVVMIYVGAVFLFMPTEATLMMIPVGLVFGILCFVLYDILLTRFAIVYERRLRHLFIRKR